MCKYAKMYTYILQCIHISIMYLYRAHCVFNQLMGKEDAASATAKNSLSKGYYSRKCQSDIMMMMFARGRSLLKWMECAADVHVLHCYSLP